MAFIKTDFYFNETSSTPVGIKVVRKESGLIGTPIAGAKTINETFVGNRDKPFFYETNMQPMSFTICFTIDDVDAWTPAIRKQVFEWLYSPRAYTEFKSMDDYDSDTSSFNKVYKLIFTSPLEFHTADLSNGYLELTAHAYPFAYTEVKTLSHTITTTPQQITVDNLTNVKGADNTFHYYPKMYIDLTGGTTSFKITNTSDDDRVFELTSLDTSEQLYIDNSLKVINTSASDDDRINNLTNKRWFRLVQGENVLNIEGTCELTFVCEFPIMI